MALRYVDELTPEQIEGKRFLCRFDFNVPMKNGSITDTTRIDETLPTIRFLLNNKASKIVLMSHLGRPKGGRDEKYSLAPVGDYLAANLNKEIILTEGPSDSAISSLLKLGTTKIVLLENLRFAPEEVANDREFAKRLASYGDIFLNDAFGSCHREHASTYGIVEYFPKKSFAGPLIRKEIAALSKIIESPARPMIALIGGAKVADKIKVIRELTPRCQAVIVGGAMAYPFLKACGKDVGSSLCRPQDVEIARKFLSELNSEKIILPLDHLGVPAEDYEQKGEQLSSSDVQLIDSQSIPQNFSAYDIGPRTITRIKEELENAKTIFWNGPFGMFENEAFSKGTNAVAKILADKKGSAFTLVGGGDSVSALKKSGLTASISHISTGGGASLEYIEAGTLSGIRALKFGVENE